ncbi:MAG: hypothetical protein ACREUV_07680 [Burkholderiales bacterium]
MSTYKSKSSSMAIVLFCSMLAPAAARADDAVDWLKSQLQITDGNPAPRLKDCPVSTYQGASITDRHDMDTNSSKWLERQLSITDGNPEGR